MARWRPSWRGRVTRFGPKAEAGQAGLHEGGRPSLRDNCAARASVQVLSGASVRSAGRRPRRASPGPRSSAPGCVASSQRLAQLSQVALFVCREELDPLVTIELPSTGCVRRTLASRAGRLREESLRRVTRPAAADVTACAPRRARRAAWCSRISRAHHRPDAVDASAAQGCAASRARISSRPRARRRRARSTRALAFRSPGNTFVINIVHRTWLACLWTRPETRSGLDLQHLRRRVLGLSPEWAILSTGVLWGNK